MAPGYHFCSRPDRVHAKSIVLVFWLGCFEGGQADDRTETPGLPDGQVGQDFGIQADVHPLQGLPQVEGVVVELVGAGLDSQLAQVGKVSPRGFSLVGFHYEIALHLADGEFVAVPLATVDVRRHHLDLPPAPLFVGGLQLEPGERIGVPLPNAHHSRQPHFSDLQTG